MGINVKIKKEDKVLEFVKRAISLYNEGTEVLSGGNIHTFRKYVYALSNLIDIDEIKEFDHISAVIKWSIAKSRNSSPLTVDDFKRYLSEVAEEIVSKKEDKFYIVFPLKIRYESLNKRLFTLLDTKIKIRNYRYIDKNFSYDELKKEAKYDNKVKESLKPSITYFVIEVYAINENQGANYAFDKFELLTSLINFVHSYERLHYQFGGESEPISLINPPKIFFSFDLNRKYIDKWITDITYDSKEIDFNRFNLEDVIERSEELIKKINSMKGGGIRDLILWAFYLHNNALVYYDKRWLSFLSFWQIFELTSLFSKKQIKQEDVRKRIVSLFKEKDPIEDIFEVFAGKRNNLVHNGKLKDFTENDLHMIIGVAQSAIMFLVDNSADIRTINDLDFFYNNINTLEKDLCAKTNVLRFIKKIKA